jgi:hypothetical protein
MAAFELHAPSLGSTYNPGMTRGLAYVEEERLRPASMLAGWTRAVAWTLLASMTLLIFAALVLGHRESTLSALERDVARGSTQHVQVTEGLGADARGYATVRVEWRSHLLGYTTSVVEARPRERGRQAAQEDGVTGLLSQDLATHLHAIDPDLQVETVDHVTGPEAHWLRWRITGWPVALLVLGWLFTVAMMISGPDPFRATKWAWFWLMISAAGPVVLIVYLAVGGPTGLARAPRPGSRRLTGGWAILLMMLVNAVVVTPSL